MILQTPPELARMALDPAVAWLLRLSIALLFAVSAQHKLRDPTGFAGTLRGYALLPEAAVPGVARAIPAVECLLALALPLAPLLDALAPMLPRVAALTATGLLGLYTGAILVNLLRGRRDIACGCLGAAAGRAPLSGALVLRNLALAAAAAATALPTTTRALHAVDALTVGAGLLTVTLAALASGRLVHAAQLARRARDVVSEPQEARWGWEGGRP